MSEARSLCAAVFVFALAACEPVSSEEYQPQTVAWLKQQIADPKKLERLDGTKVRLAGVLHGYATGSVFLDLRPDAAKQIGTDREHPADNECVSVVAAPAKFPSVEGSHVATLYGRIFLLEIPHVSPTEALVKGSHNGVRFQLYCGYGFPGKYPHIELDRVERIAP
jgi:hypothetical protein